MAQTLDRLKLRFQKVYAEEGGVKPFASAIGFDPVIADRF